MISNYTGCPPPKKQIGHANLIPPDIVDGRKLPQDHGYVGEERFYVCTDGYVQTGIIKIICIGDGYVAGWTTPEHGCTGRPLHHSMSQKDIQVCQIDIYSSFGSISNLRTSPITSIQVIHMCMMFGFTQIPFQHSQYITIYSVSCIILGSSGSV